VLGQQLIAAIYNALATSPQWKNTLFVITYDENGGYYDHVAPPTDQTSDEFAADGFDQLGFRVPTLVVGPYAKQGEVVSTQYDHTSMLKHLQNMFDLDPLYGRVDAATDLSDCIDQDRLAAGDAADPAEIPAVEVNESDITMACAEVEKAQHDVLTLADRYPDIFKRFDRRHQMRDYAYFIGDYLEKHNKGRIIRGK
jgi:phospholipase C